jgi:hypothetical protein
MPHLTLLLVVMQLKTVVMKLPHLTLLLVVMQLKTVVMKLKKTMKSVLRFK